MISTVGWFSFLVSFAYQCSGSLQCRCSKWILILRQIQCMPKWTKIGYTFRPQEGISKIQLIILQYSRWGELHIAPWSWRREFVLKRTEIQRRKGSIQQVQQVTSIITIAMHFTCAILVLLASLPLVGQLSILKINKKLSASWIHWSLTNFMCCIYIICFSFGLMTSLVIVDTPVLYVVLIWLL
jgi:hypothetical protein